MSRWILRVVATLGILGAVVFGACLLLPERFAVNVPIRNALFGTPGATPSSELLGTRVRVPDGLAVGLFAELPRVRALRMTPAGDLLASLSRCDVDALLIGPQFEPVSADEQSRLDRKKDVTCPACGHEFQT